MLATEAKEKILTNIKESENGLTDKELGERLGLSDVRVNWYLNRMMEEDADLLSRARTDAHSKYVYKLNKVVLPLPEEENQLTFDIPKPKVEDNVSRLYNQGKNSEGYVDPTSAKAMKSVGRLDGFMAGGIYKTNTGSWFLVLRPYPDTLLGYNIEETTYAASTDRTVAWPYRTFTRVVYVNRLQSISSKKLKHSDFSKCPFETMKEVIRKSPLHAARVIEIEKEVEKIVEVEKPVEVIKEVPVENTVIIDRDTSQLDLLNQKVAIYEDILCNMGIISRKENK